MSKLANFVYKIFSKKMYLYYLYLFLLSPNVLMSLNAVAETEIFNLDYNISQMLKVYIPRYHKPAIDHNVVYVLTDVFNIIAVDEVAETLTTKLWFFLAYIIPVPELVWEEQLPGLYQFYPEQQAVWKPDIIVLNNVETLDVNWGDPIIRRYHCTTYTKDPIYCGTAVVFPISQTEVTTCSYDVTDFPFDVQNCKIQIGPWFTEKAFLANSALETPYSIISTDVNDSGMSLASYEDNSQWELVGSTLEYKTRFSQHDIAKEFQVMEYSLKLKRQPQFFIYTLICPCFTLTILSVLSIYIPVESGEKIGLGVTILLAQVVNLLILSSILPASSRYFPKIGYYFLVTMAIIVTSLVYNSFIISFYYHGYEFLRSVKVFPKIWKSKQPDEGPDIPEITKAQHAEPVVISNEWNTEEPDTSKAERTTADERRQRVCIIADHVFAAIVSVLILIVHAVFFGGHL